MTVIQLDSGKWAVTDGERILAKFDTNSQAWSWIDRNKPSKDDETQRRIGAAIGQW